MAGVSTPAMAAAVTQAGGLGSLGLGASSPSQAAEAIRAVRQLTHGPLHVNLFCHAPAQRDATREAAWVAHLAPLFHEVGREPPTELHEIYPSFVGHQAMLAVLLQERPEVISFHFGLPTDAQIQALKATGAFLMATATHLDEARRIEAAGLDAIVAQGIEAGGHRGMFDPTAPDEGLSTEVLVKTLLQHCNLPVVAAGGLMDGQDIRAMWALGAHAVQLGTAFVLCPESAASPAYRADMGRASTLGTHLTATLSGRPARGLKNRFMAWGEAPEAPPPADYPVAYDAAKQLHAAASARGVVDFGAHWAGQGAPAARSLPAAELVQALMREAALRT